jgi:F-type H+-transporting ATPase subunit gamma
MQMVAASKMRRAQQSALKGRPFVQMLYRIQREATSRMQEFRHPLLEVRKVKKLAVIVLAADKGLCGSLNTNLFRVAAEFDPKTTIYIAAGKKAAQFLARTHRQLAAEFTYSDNPQFSEARTISKFARDFSLSREVDQVDIAATRFENTLTQHPVCLEFLPVGEIKSIKIPGARAESELAEDRGEALFEPSAEAVLQYLLSHYLDIYVYQVMLNAKASELSARMVSMKNATDNAESLIRDLTLEYNKIRQGNITRELLEIAGGQAE